MNVDTQEKEKGARRKRAPFKAFFILLPFLAILTLELFLRAIGFEYWPERPDPTCLPYLASRVEGDKTIYEPSRYYQLWNHHFQVQVPKEKEHKRIACLGGSATYGGSFGRPGSFSEWLSVMLSAVDRDAKWEVINAGQNGASSFGVLGIAAEIMMTRPDLVIIYCGNNEFRYHRLNPRPDCRGAWLKKIKLDSRTLRLGGMIADKLSNSEDKSKFDAGRVIGRGVEEIDSLWECGWDVENEEEVFRRYAGNLDKMVQAAKQGGARVFLCSIPVNLKDREPFGKYDEAGLEERTLREVNGFLDAGDEKYLEGDVKKALDYYIKAEESAPALARVKYRIACSYFSLGEKELASRHFHAALDLEAIKDRANGRINAAIREVAQKNGVTFVDLESAMADNSSAGIPGDDEFSDEVHPTLSGYEIIAERLLAAMIEEELVEPDKEWIQTARGARDYYRDHMPHDFLYASYMNAAKYNAAAARFERAKYYIKRAIQYKPADDEALDLLFALEKIKPPGIEQEAPWGTFDYALTLSGGKGKAKR